MTTLTSTLAVRLLDDVSGPAGKAAGALRGLGASGADLKKLAAASPETARLVRELERLKAVSAKVDTFKVASRSLDDMGLNLKKARSDLAQAEHLLARRQKTVEYFNRIKIENPERYAKWKMDGLTAGVASNLDKAKRARDKAAKAIEPAKSEFMDQGRHVRALRNELGGLGLPLNGLKAAEAGLKASIDATNAAIAKQPALLAAAEAKAHDLARASKEQLRAAVEAGKAERATRAANAVRTARVERARVEVEARRPKFEKKAVAKAEAASEARKAARAEADPILKPERGVADLRKVPELGKAVADRQALKAQAGAIEDFRVDSRALKQASQAYNLAQQDLRKLKAEMASAPSDAVASKLVAVHAAVARTSAAFQAQSAAVRASRAALAEAGVSVDRLKSAETGLAASIAKATAELQRQTAALGQNAKAQARAAERAAARKDAAGALGAGAAVVAGYKGKEIGKKAVVSAAEFDIGVRKQRYFNGLDGVAQAPLIAQAKRIGQETQFSNLDVVKAQTKSMQGLPASFGPDLKAQVAQGLLENVRNYATVMEADLETSAEGIRSYLQSTGKDISTKEKALAESQKATNQLVKMAKLGGMNDEDVQQFMKYAGASGTSAGLTTESLMSLGALARRGGLRGDEAGTFVRSASSKLVSPTRQGLAAYNAAGINHSDYVSMPERLSTAALENQFKTTLGKGFTDEVRKRLDVVNADKDLIKDRANYTKAVTDAVAPILGKKGDGTVRASDTQTAAKAAGIFHKVSAQSVDVERLLDDMMSKNMTLAQLNAVLTDKHGGKGAITQRQWDEFKASREGIKKAGDDPNLAADMAKGIMAGLGGSLENLKGSVDNLILTIGTANEGWLKTAMDAGGSAVDTFSNLPPGAQQALSIGAGAGVLAASTYGTAKLLTTLLGGSSGAALSASAVALDGSAAALTAAAARLGASSAAGVASGAATGAATAGAGAATAGGVSLGLGGSLILGGAVAGAAIDSATPGTNAGLTGLVTGAESSLEQTNRVLREERARSAITARLGPQAWETGRPRVMPEADTREGYASEVSVSRGALGDFLLGQRKEAVTLPAMPAGAARVMPAPAAGVAPKASTTSTPQVTVQAPKAPAAVASPVTVQAPPAPASDPGVVPHVVVPPTPAPAAGVPPKAPAAVASPVTVQAPPAPAPAPGVVPRVVVPPAPPPAPGVAPKAPAAVASPVTVQAPPAPAPMPGVVPRMVVPPAPPPAPGVAPKAPAAVASPVTVQAPPAPAPAPGVVPRVVVPPAPSPVAGVPPKAPAAVASPVTVQAPPAPAPAPGVVPRVVVPPAPPPAPGVAPKAPAAVASPVTVQAPPAPAPMPGVVPRMVVPPAPPPAPGVAPKAPAAVASPVTVQAPPAPAPAPGVVPRVVVPPAPSPVAGVAPKALAAVASPVTVQAPPAPAPAPGVVPRVVVPPAPPPVAGVAPKALAAVASPVTVQAPPAPAPAPGVVPRVVVPPAPPPAPGVAPKAPAAVASPVTVQAPPAPAPAPGVVPRVVVPPAPPPVAGVPPKAPAAVASPVTVQAPPAPAPVPGVVPHLVVPPAPPPVAGVPPKAPAAVASPVTVQAPPAPAPVPGVVPRLVVPQAPPPAPGVAPKAPAAVASPVTVNVAPVAVPVSAASGLGVVPGTVSPPAPPPVPGVVPRVAAPIAEAERAARDPQRLALPPVPDADGIAEATAALAAFKAELAGVKADLATGLDMPGIGAGLEARKAELERLIADTQAKLQALGAERVAPSIDGASVDAFGVKADAAQAKLQALGATSVTPSVGSGPIDALLAKVETLLAKLAQVGTAASTANARVGQVNASAVAAVGGRSTGQVGQRLGGSFTNDPG